MLDNTFESALSQSRKEEIEEELQELSYVYNVQLSDKVREVVDQEYWKSLQNVLKKGNHLTLPAAYQLDSVNWLHTFFDYLASDPVETAQGGIFQTDYLFPDTIIIKQRRAYAWVSADNGNVHRREKISELQPRLLFDGLCNSYRKKWTLNPSTVLAYMIAGEWNEAKGEWVASVEYFNQASLKIFLYERLRMEDKAGILQLFIPPPGSRNSVMRAWWTPHSVQIEQRANINDIDALHVPLGVRAATFDASEHITEMRNIPGQDLRDEVAEQLEWMIDHVSSLLPPSHRVWQGVFYFKMGTDGKLYFLWCASLQFTTGDATEGQGYRRPSTPQCHETHQLVHTWDDQVEQEQMLLEAGTCPSCGRGENGEETHIAYNVRYFSLVRRLCPNLAKAVEMEKRIVKEMCKSDALWAEYLQTSEACKYVKFGESLSLKFPRPNQRHDDSNAKKKRRRQSVTGGMLIEDGLDKDRHFMRTVALMGNGQKEVSFDKQREFVLYAASNEGFGNRTAAVCQQCCVELNDSEVAQARTDLLECTSPYYINSDPGDSFRKLSVACDRSPSDDMHRLVYFHNPSAQTQLPESSSYGSSRELTAQDSLASSSYATLPYPAYPATLLVTQVSSEEGQKERERQAREKELKEVEELKQLNQRISELSEKKGPEWRLQSGGRPFNAESRADSKEPPAEDGPSVVRQLWQERFSISELKGTVGEYHDLAGEIEREIGEVKGRLRQEFVDMDDDAQIAPQLHRLSVMSSAEDHTARPNSATSRHLSTLRYHKANRRRALRLLSPKSQELALRHLPDLYAAPAPRERPGARTEEEDKNTVRLTAFDRGKRGEAEGGEDFEWDEGLRMHMQAQVASSAVNRRVSDSTATRFDRLRRLSPLRPRPLSAQGARRRPSSPGLSPGLKGMQRQVVVSRSPSTERSESGKGRGGGASPKPEKREGERGRPGKRGQREGGEGQLNSRARLESAYDVAGEPRYSDENDPDLQGAAELASAKGLRFVGDREGEDGATLHKSQSRLDLVAAASPPASMTDRPPPVSPGGREISWGLDGINRENSDELPMKSAMEIQKMNQELTSQRGSTPVKGNLRHGTPSGSPKLGPRGVSFQSDAPPMETQPDAAGASQRKGGGGGGGGGGGRGSEKAPKKGGGGKKDAKKEGDVARARSSTRLVPVPGAQRQTRERSKDTWEATERKLWRGNGRQEKEESERAAKRSHSALGVAKMQFEKKHGREEGPGERAPGSGGSKGSSGRWSALGHSEGASKAPDFGSMKGREVDVGRMDRMSGRQKQAAPLQPLTRSFSMTRGDPYKLKFVTEWDPSASRGTVRIAGVMPGAAGAGRRGGSKGGSSGGGEGSGRRDSGKGAEDGEVVGEEGKGEEREEGETAGGRERAEGGGRGDGGSQPDEDASHEKDEEVDREEADREGADREGADREEAGERGKKVEGTQEGEGLGAGKKESVESQGGADRAPLEDSERMQEEKAGEEGMVSGEDRQSTEAVEDTAGEDMAKRQAGGAGEEADRPRGHTRAQDSKVGVEEEEEEQKSQLDYTADFEEEDDGGGGDPEHRRGGRGEEARQVEETNTTAEETAAEVGEQVRSFSGHAHVLVEHSAEPLGEALVKAAPETEARPFSRGSGRRKRTGASAEGGGEGEGGARRGFAPDSGEQEDRDAISSIVEARVYLTNYRGAERAGELEGLGVRHIVCVNDHNNAFPDRFQYYNVSTLEDQEDHDATEHFDGVVRFMEEALGSGGAVCVHCAAGVSRSSTMVIAFLMAVERMSLYAAFALVISKRKVIWPNRSFMVQLIRFEQDLKGKGILPAAAPSLEIAEYDRWTAGEQAR